MLGSVTNDIDYSNYRWTVDTREDLELIREIYNLLDDNCTWESVVTLMQLRPELSNFNNKVIQKIV